jgi:uncharacterized protein YdaU (DUF1376 family)
MAKNPIFPLYYNDILGSTKTWTDEEFGAYVRLLIEQWDNGFIPNPYQNSTNELQPDFQRLTRISTSVEKNWRLLSTKFNEHEEGMKNAKLEEIRDLKRKHSEKQRQNVRNRYQKSTKQSTKNLPLEDEYENEDKDTQLGGVGEEDVEFEKLDQKALAPRMVRVFREYHPKYPIDTVADCQACLDIAYKIAKGNGWTKESATNGRMNDVLKEWRVISEFTKTDKWYKTRSLTDINKEYQRLIQSITKSNEGTKESVGRTFNADKL